MISKSEHVLIIGKRSAKDYVGARSYYLYKALTACGVRATVYDVDSRTPDPPISVSHVIDLMWIQYMDQESLGFIARLPGKKCLWTEQSSWYEERRQLAVGTFSIDPESIYDIIRFSTPEGMTTSSIPHHRSSRHGVWPPLIDETSIPAPSERRMAIFVDSKWPEEWSSGDYNAWEVVDAVMPSIKESLGVKVITQPAPDGSVPAWADETLNEGTDMSAMVASYSECACYVATHHELLGLAMMEAQVAGVPVVGAIEHCCSAVREGGGFIGWRRSQGEVYLGDPVDPLGRFALDRSSDVFDDPSCTPQELLTKAIERGVEMGTDRSECERIRARAVSRYGVESWWSSSGRRFLSGTWLS